MTKRAVSDSGWGTAVSEDFTTGGVASQELSDFVTLLMGYGFSSSHDDASNAVALEQALKEQDVADAMEQLFIAGLLPTADPKGGTNSWWNLFQFTRVYLSLFVSYEQEIFLPQSREQEALVPFLRGGGHALDVPRFRDIDNPRSITRSNLLEIYRDYVAWPDGLIAGLVDVLKRVPVEEEKPPEIPQSDPQYDPPWFRDGYWWRQKRPAANTGQAPLEWWDVSAQRWMLFHDGSSSSDNGHQPAAGPSEVTETETHYNLWVERTQLFLAWQGGKLGELAWKSAGSDPSVSNVEKVLEKLESQGLPSGILDPYFTEAFNDPAKEHLTSLPGSQAILSVSYNNKEHRDKRYRGLFMCGLDVGDGSWIDEKNRELIRGLLKAGDQLSYLQVKNMIVLYRRAGDSDPVLVPFMRLAGKSLYGTEAEALTGRIVRERNFPFDIFRVHPPQLKGLSTARVTDLIKEIHRRHTVKIS